MKLYTGIGPNPRVVHICLAEKAIDIERISVDLMAGENRQQAHLARNPAGQLPCLELDDGSTIAEITAICEYLDEKHPSPPLVGTTLGPLNDPWLMRAPTASPNSLYRGIPRTTVTP